MNDAEMHLGQCKVELDHRDIVQGRDGRTRGDERSGTHLAETEQARERSADQPVVQARDEGLVTGPGLGQPGLGLVHVGNGNAALFEKVLQPIVPVLGVLPDRFLLLQQGGLLFVGQFDQDIALLDEIAVVEADVPDRVGDFRGNGHGLVGLCRTDRLDDVRNGADHCRFGDHQRRPAKSTLG